MELRPKTTEQALNNATAVLRTKGEKSAIEVEQLVIDLIWKSEVDLDLMLYGISKTGDKVIYLFSKEYGVETDRCTGSLAAWPYMELGADEGVGESGGAAGVDHKETIKIAKIDPSIKELYIVTLNYTDAAAKKDVSFKPYGAVINIMNQKGESIVAPLDSDNKGHVAVIAKIDNSGIIAQLVNENRIISLDEFEKTIPGANVFLK